MLVPGLVRQSAIRCVDADLDRIVFLNHERFSRKICCAAWETFGKHGIRGNVVSVVAGTVVHAGHSYGNRNAAVVVR